MKKQLIVLLLAVVAVFLARPGWAQKGPIRCFLRR
jgi:hypothetical protein